MSQRPEGQGLTPPSLDRMMPLLYDPSNCDRLFTGITVGDNKVFNAACCERHRTTTSTLVSAEDSSGP